MPKTHKENQDATTRARPYRPPKRNDALAAQLTDDIKKACQIHTIFAPHTKRIKGSLQEGAKTFQNNLELIKQLNNNYIIQEYYRLGEHIHREAPISQLLTGDKQLQ